MIAKLQGSLQIIRPELPLAAGLCVVLGEALALGGFPSIQQGMLGFALGFFLSSSAMVFNDYFDLEVDRINAPHHPLPAGLLTPQDAIVLGIVTLLVSLGIALFFQPIVAVLVLIAWVLGFLYNWKLKATGLWGNLIVSTNVAATFILGGILAGEPGSLIVWGFALIAFSFDLAEEIAGDAMDIEGDRKRGSQSIAIRWGRQAALRVSAGLFLWVIVLTILHYILGVRSLYYVLPIAVMDIAIGFFTLRLLKSQTAVEGRKYMRRMYLIATACLLIFLVGWVL